jgi:hypothetical protein
MNTTHLFTTQIMVPVCTLMITAFIILVFRELRERHVRRKKFERRCTTCGSTNVARWHLRIKHPENSDDFFCQTQMKCLEPNCACFGIIKKEKEDLRHFSWWRKHFRKSQFSENAKVEQFIGPMRRQLEKMILGKVQKESIWQKAGTASVAAPSGEPPGDAKKAAVS